jgi:glutamyl-tRNA synthetase
MGFLPEALCNYLALLGWAFDGEQELFTRQDLLAKFSLERVSKTPSVFDQEKANWVNAQYLKKLDMSQKISLAKPWVQQVAKGKPLTDNWLENLLLALGERIKRFDEIPEQSEYLFAEITQWDEKAKKHLCKEQAMSTLEMIQKNIPTLDFSSGEKLEQQMRVLAETEEISLSKMVHPLRGALTGKSVSFGIFDVMVLLGKETVKKRLQNTMTEFSKKEK